MPPRSWDDEEEDARSVVSSGPSSPVLVPTRRANRFDDEEDDDDDVLDSWDAAEDSDVEREREKKAAEAKAKAEAEAAANKKSKAERIAEHKAERARQQAAAEEAKNETEEQRRERLRVAEKESDLKHAEDLFSNIGVPSGRKAAPGASVVVDTKDPSKVVDLSTLSIFNPVNKTGFDALRNALTPVISQHAKKPHYTTFLQEFAKQLAKELPSDQIKKIASSMTALSNEKLREEKTAEKGGKKTKAQKTKTSVNMSHSANDTMNTYDDDFDDDDFM